MKYVNGTEEYTKLIGIRNNVKDRYENELFEKGNPKLWKLILECVELIIVFTIRYGKKINWLSPIVIWEGLKLIKKIISLVILYINKKDKS